LLKYYIFCQQILDGVFEVLTILKRYHAAGIDNETEEDILTKKMRELCAARTMAVHHFEDIIAPQFASNFPPIKPKCPERYRIIILERQVARQEKMVYREGNNYN